MIFQWMHRLAVMAGQENALPFLTRYAWGKNSSIALASRAAFCVGYDRYMDQAVKDQN